MAAEEETNINMKERACDFPEDLKKTPHFSPREILMTLYETLPFREVYGVVPLSHSILHKQFGKVKTAGF